MSQQSPAIAARCITSCTRETSAFCNEDFKGSMFLELHLAAIVAGPGNLD